MATAKRTKQTDENEETTNMNKKIIASLAIALTIAISGVASTVGCGGSGNGGSGGGGGGGTAGGGGGGGGGTPDMAFVCSQNPTSDPDFLNSCAPAGVDTVEIDPFFPTLAPGGTLPPIQ
jgi:hypothetical protein